MTFQIYDKKYLKKIEFRYFKSLSTIKETKKNSSSWTFQRDEIQFDTHVFWLEDCQSNGNSST